MLYEDEIRLNTVKVPKQWALYIGGKKGEGLEKLKSSFIAITKNQ